MNFTDFLILALATWRVSSLLVDERGPWDIFVKIRSLAGMTHDENGEVAEVPDGFFSQLLSCIWCTSVWTGLGIGVLYYLLGDLAVLIFLPLSLSSVAILLSGYIKSI